MRHTARLSTARVRAPCSAHAIRTRRPKTRLVRSPAVRTLPITVNRYSACLHEKAYRAKCDGGLDGGTSPRTEANGENRNPRSAWKQEGEG